MPLRGRLGLLAAAALLLAAPSFASPLRLPRLAVCGGGALRPDFVLLGCGDGGQYLADVRWSAWTATGALGTAVWWQNRCTPDCAAGHFRRVAIVVRLTRPRSCGSPPRRLFTRMQLLPHASAPVTVRLPTLGARCP